MGIPQVVSFYREGSPECPSMLLGAVHPVVGMNNITNEQWRITLTKSTVLSQGHESYKMLTVRVYKASMLAMRMCSLR